jgi:hypothetical protein
MILHTGTSWGYGALLTLLPDLGVGIYTSVTGPDDSYYGRRLTHMYIMDLLLGETPWIDHKTACTFPEPWAPAKQRKSYGSSPAKKMNKLEAEKYVGSYGNFGYGNITFLYNDTSEILELHYGELGLWNLNSEGDDTFSGKGQGLMWVRDISNIFFESLEPAAEDGGLYKVTVNFESKDPPVFIKGLLMSDAPAPPDPTTCGSSPVGSIEYIIISAADHIAKWTTMATASIVTLIYEIL